MSSSYLGIRHVVFLAFTFVVFGQCTSNQTKDHEHNLPDSLLVMERAFSKYASDHTTRDAFLHFLSDTSILFKPAAVNGKEFWQGLEDQGELLYWQPAHVGVSAHGNLGFTTGPYFLQPSRSSDSVRFYGHYMSVWKKEGDTWRVLIDMGIGHDSTNMSPIPVMNTYEGLGGKYGDLIQRENQYVASYAEQEIRSEFFSTECLVLRPRRLPVRSIENIEAVLKDEGVSVTYGEPTAFVSDSGELAVTYGDAEVTIHADTRKVGLHFVRIWSFDQVEGWKIVLDIVGG